MAFEIEFYKTKDGKEPVADSHGSAGGKRYRTPDAVFRVSG